jgi:ER membrane protein complex subunit 8/9
MPLECTLDSAALLKILLHAAKYPASPINGLLIGTAKQLASVSDTASDSSGGSLQIIDAIPLFHSFLHLSMPLETALLQVSVADASAANI